MKNFLDNQVKDKIGVAIAKYDLTVESKFIPFSKSRNAGEKMPSLNWQVTLKWGDKKILTTDYSAGCGHAPFYKNHIHNAMRLSIWEHDRLMAECENGFPVDSRYENMIVWDKKRPILPDSRDVIYSLLLDSEVLEYATFEAWAGEFGYDGDSRQAEKTYNACMKIALQFRQLGESVISELRDAYQDY